jgi:trehalose-phosphatase
LHEETECFAAQPRLLLCTDFDGTLTPIQSHPERVELDSAMRRLLRNLAHLPQTAVAIVSGRNLIDLRQRIALPQLWYIGNHGLEIMGPDMAYLHPDLDKLHPTLAHWLVLLRTKLAHVPGLFLEDKLYTASVHYRLVKPELRSKIQRMVRATCPKQFEIRSGKMVWELRPRVRWDKGWGIDWLNKRIKAPTIYLGDDTTDEDAFAKLAPSALTIKVGTAQTKARFTLPNVAAANRWLSRFLEKRRAALGLAALSIANN